MPVLQIEVMRYEFRGSVYSRILFRSDVIGFIRKWLGGMGVHLTDDESGLLHAAHAAWNSLARLELYLKVQEGNDA